MQGCLPSSALLIYRQLTHTELIIDSRAKEISTLIFLKTDHPVSDAEATKLMEKAFIEQTGLVITHLEGKKVSVTYNDALPIVATKQGKESAR